MTYTIAKRVQEEAIPRFFNELIMEYKQRGIQLDDKLKLKVPPAVIKIAYPVIPHFEMEEIVTCSIPERRFMTEPPIYDTAELPMIQLPVYPDQFGDDYDPYNDNIINFDEVNRKRARNPLLHSNRSNKRRKLNSNNNAKIIEPRTQSPTKPKSKSKSKKEKTTKIKSKTSKKPKTPKKRIKNKSKKKRKRKKKASNTESESERDENMHFTKGRIVSWQGGELVLATDAMKMVDASFYCPVSPKICKVLKYKNLGPHIYVHQHQESNTFNFRIGNHGGKCSYHPGTLFLTIAVAKNHYAPIGQCKSSIVAVDGQLRLPSRLSAWDNKRRAKLQKDEQEQKNQENDQQSA